MSEVFVLTRKKKDTVIVGAFASFTAAWDAANATEREEKKDAYVPLGPSRFDYGDFKPLVHPHSPDWEYAVWSLTVSE